MVCLDTTFLIDFLRGDPAAEKKLQYYTDRYEPLTTTPINAAELFKGAYRSKNRTSELAKVKMILEYLDLLQLSLPVCEKFGKLVNELSTGGSSIGDLDSIIASTAITYREILLTRNRAHFERVPGLVVDSW